METQRYRIQTTGITWYSVNVKESMEAREKFIQPDDEHKHIVGSAFDKQWLNDIPKNLPTIITAQGLLMYFEEKQVQELIHTISKYFHQVTFIFDTILLWFSKKTMKGMKKLGIIKYQKFPGELIQIQLKKNGNNGNRTFKK